MNEPVDADVTGGEMVAPLEVSEWVMDEVAGAVREEIGGGEEVCRAALEVLHGRAAARVGIDWEGGGVDSEIRARAAAVVDRLRDRLGASVDRALEEPHALGWFHQYFGEPERAASHRDHHERESKHADAGVTTQLYTPRWIADVLVEAAVGADERRRPAVLDPAVGGGQMLLAAYDALRRRAPEAPPSEIVDRLAGRDVDARAVEVARRNLALRVARDAGERRPEAERLLEERLTVADSLFESVPGARCVVTNPPYMGLRSMPEELKRRVRDRFEPFHRDLYSAFIRRCHELAESRVAILAQQTVWYLKSFAEARRRLFEKGALELFVHLGPGAFASLDGEKANVAAFVQRASEPEERSGETTFVDLRDVDERSDMRAAVARLAAGSDGGSDRVTCEPRESVTVLPGRPLAYWLPDRLRRQFDSGPRLGDFAEIPGCQNKTGANRKYVREWSELEAERGWRRPLTADPVDRPDRLEPPADVRWIPYSKGGGFAPWWGNWQHLVDWSESARAYYRENSTSNLVPERYRFREGICYTDFGGDSFQARWMPPGVLFDMAGPAIFVDPRERGGRRLFAVLAVLNTTPVRMLLNAMNPSIHYQVTDLRRLPLPEWDDATGAELAELAERNVRDVRRIASDLDESPVPAVDDSPPEAGRLARRCRERVDRIERLVFELYGLPAGSVESIRPRHRYFPRVTDRD